MDYNKEEKHLIATHDPKLYATYRCEEDGLFQMWHESNTGICPFCKTKCNRVPNIQKLKEKFRKELKLPQS